ncbi:MAG: hypothetical protein WBX04_09225 [Candidatus Sulfotelmatobacter sp.]
MNSNIIPHPDELRLADNMVLPAKKKVPRHSPGQLFLKGPVPMNWLCLAARLPGAAFQVGVALWFRAGLKKSAHIVFPMNWLGELFGVKRMTAYRGLAALEKAGLAAVGKRRPGRRTEVTILEVPSS